MKYNYKRLVCRKLKLTKDDELHIFDTIKDVAKFLKLDLSKSTDTAALSVYSRSIMDDDFTGYTREGPAKKLLGDWKLTREEVYHYYERDELFHDYEYGLYLHMCTFNEIWSGVGVLEQSRYISNINTIFKQLPKLKNIKFVYGDYRDL